MEHDLTQSRPYVLVAGCGNVDAGDDAFGPLVARELRRRNGDDARTRVVDLGLAPVALLDHLPGPAGLIVVDAVVMAGDADGLVERDWSVTPSPAQLPRGRWSTHGIGIADEIELARATGVLPPAVWLIAAAVGEVRAGAPLSAAVAALVPVAVRRVIDRGRAILDGP